MQFLLSSKLTDQEVVDRYRLSMNCLKLYRDIAPELDLPLPTRIVGFLEIVCVRTPSMGHAKIKCLVETKDGIGVMEYYETKDEHCEREDLTWEPVPVEKVA